MTSPRIDHILDAHQKLKQAKVDGHGKKYWDYISALRKKHGSAYTTALHQHVRSLGEDMEDPCQATNSVPNNGESPYPIMKKSDRIRKILKKKVTEDTYPGVVPDDKKYVPDDQKDTEPVKKVKTKAGDIIEVDPPMKKPISQDDGKDK